MVKEFLKAENIIQHAVREVHNFKYLLPGPQIVIQPMEKLEGGLADVEVGGFRELALGAGARDTVAHAGMGLSVHNYNFEDISKKEVYK